MIVQTALEHSVTIWTRPAQQIIDTNEHSGQMTTREMGMLLGSDSVVNLKVLLGLQ